MSSPRLEDRYDLLDELPHVTGGRLFRARDLAFGEIVGLKQLGPHCGLALEPRQRLHNIVRHLQCLHHPHLARIYSFDVLHGIIVQEWVQGVSLLDLLRRRRELSLDEALHLLATLPGTLDFLAREAVPVPRPLLSKIYVEFAVDTNVNSLTVAPLADWPAFRLMLNPLSLRGLVGETVAEDLKQTVVVDPRTPTDIQEGYGPRELALLLYELLGGRVREVDSRRYSPLSSLREAGNAVLRRELLAMPHADCTSLWKALLAAQAPAVPAPPPVAAEESAQISAWHIPDAFLGAVPTGTVLNLEPHDAEILPIRLVARPQFTVGRSAAMADFVARILPQNEENDTRTNRLSRIHTLLEIQHGQIQMCDGNGSGPSLNGSFLDGQPLASNRRTVLPHRAQLALGEEYALDLIPLEDRDPAPWRIDNLHAWRGPTAKPALAPLRAVVCEPAPGHAASRHTVWLFSEIGFGLDGAGHVVWDTRERGAHPAAFHYLRDCFWLRNGSLGALLGVGAAGLGDGQIVPLASGQTIRLGPHTYTIHLG